MNHIPYFTEIEERFQQRRGSILMLSTLDWALIETWHEAGIPLEAVLRGIDEAFDKHESRKLRAKGRIGKINGLAWAAQSVMQSADLTAEASVGLASETKSRDASGFETEPVAAYLEQNAQAIEAAAISPETATRLRELAADLRTNPTQHLEDLDRTLSVLEEKMVAALLASTPEEELVALREQAARELAPYKGKMQAVQIKQVQQQFLQKRLLEAKSLPRLSLFYMSHG
jgi:hypothetical protein